MRLTRPVTGFTTDSTLSASVSWNSMTGKTLLFELRSEHAPQDGFVRSCSEGRKSRRPHQALLVCAAVHQSNFHKRRTIQLFAVDIGDSREEAQSLSLATDDS